MANSWNFKSLLAIIVAQFAACTNLSGEEKIVQLKTPEMSVLVIFYLLLSADFSLMLVLYSYRN